MKTKFKLKTLNSGTLGKALTAGVLACVLSCGAVMPDMAEAKTFITDSESLGVHFGIGADLSKGIYEIPGVSVNGKVDVIQLANRYHLFDATQSYNGDTNEIYAYTDKSGNVRYFASAIDSMINPGDNVNYRYKIYELTESEVNAALGSGANVSALIGNGGTSYTAGNGITISSDNKVSVKASNGIDVGSNGVSVKAGTNVTVNANGVSVTGNGSVADGNTGLINGDKLYDEVRSSANGNYVKTTQTTGVNLKALDTGLTNLENSLSDGSQDLKAKTITTTGDGTIGRNLTVNGTTTLKDLIATGDTSLKNTTVNGTLDVKDTATFEKAVTMKDNLTVEGTTNLKDTNIDGKLDVTGDGHIGGNLTVDGTTTLKDLLTAEANAVFKKDVHIEQNLAVDGKSDFKDDMTVGNDDDGATLTVGKEGADNGKLVVNGEGNVTNKFTVGNGDADDNLTVNGTTNLNGNTTIGSEDENADLLVNGNATVTGDTNMNGNADIGKDLHVKGTSTLDGDVTAGSNMTVKGDTFMEGNADIGKDLHVKGTSTLDGDVTAGSNMTVKGDTFMEGNADIGKDLHVKGISQLDGNTTIGTEDAPADLKVTGNAHIGKNLVVEGTADIHDNTHLYKDLQVDGKTNIGGDTYIGNDDDGAVLTVGKDGTENGKFVLNGTGDIKGDTNIGNDDDGATLTVGKEGADNGKFVLNGDGNVTNTFTVGNGDAGDNLTVNGTTNLNGDTTIGSKDANADLTVFGNSNVTGNGHYGGNLKVDGNANVGGTLTADRVVTNDIQLPSGSLNGRLDEMDTRMDKVGAGAAALAGLHYPGFVPGQKFVMAMGVGNYHGKTASAIGAQYRFNENVAMNVAGTFGNGENMISGGLSFAFGKSKLPRDRENEALKAENKMLLKRLEKLEKWAKNFALIEQKKAAFGDIPNNHWARNAVETLKGNGYVEGYPDGEFKGDKRMSRYEYAQMLYRALSKGASISEEHLKEYEPELRRVQKDYEAEETVREMEARREAQAMASAQQGPKALEVQPAVQEEPVNAQPVQEAKAEAPAAPEAAPAIAKVPPMEEGMSRYDYARQIFEVLKGGAAIDRSLAMEFEPELKQIIREERAKGTLPQQ